MVTQADRFSRAGNFIALGFIMSQHIGTQGTFSVIRAGRLVIGHPVGRNQQGGNGIHQRGFSGADVAGKQSVFTIKLQRPYSAIKSAPIEHLQPDQPKSG